jgi:hypothetical protein
MCILLGALTRDTSPRPPHSASPLFGGEVPMPHQGYISYTGACRSPSPQLYHESATRADAVQGKIANLANEIIGSSEA